MPTLDEHLLKAVNSSGFLLQLAVEYAVGSQELGYPPWEVVVREHPWLDGDRSRYVDLIIGRPTLRLVIECKRPSGGEWIFLVPPEIEETYRARLGWTVLANDREGAGWHDTSAAPGFHTSPFCVVRGQDRDTPMLERLASEAARACDAIAAEELEIARNRGHTHRARYVPTIVTAAEMFVARIAPGDISIAAGTTSIAEFERVSAVWFRKSLVAQPTPSAEPIGLKAANTDKERSVLIISSQAFVDVLRRLDVADSFPEGAARRSDQPYMARVAALGSGPGSEDVLTLRANGRGIADAAQVQWDGDIRPVPAVAAHSLEVNVRFPVGRKGKTCTVLLRDGTSVSIGIEGI